MVKRILVSKFLWMLLWYALSGCKTEAQEPGPIEPEQRPGLDGVRVAWDFASEKQLASVGGYARVIRLANKSYVCVYEDWKGNSVQIRSNDGGENWSIPMVVFEQFTANNASQSTLVNCANPEICQLQDGTLVMAVNYRPATAEVYPFAIAVSRSADNGFTWSSPSVIYEAGPRFSDGCWEPALLQLPDGTLQVYFANENPYRTTDEQEISMLSSHDNGQTWEPNSKMVCFRAGKRDGMPVPVLSGNHVLVSIEDNKSGQFKPYVVRSVASDNWKNPVLGDQPNRNSALKESLPESVYAGAPYLLKLPTGELVMSYQSTEFRSNDWEKSTMEVVIGDAEGRDFTKKSRPFEVSLDREAKWNSLSVYDDHTLLAVSSTNFKGGSVGVWIKKGRIIPELYLERSAIQVDGTLSVNEWGELLPLFIGSAAKSQSRTSVRRDEEDLYFGTSAQGVVVPGSSATPILMNYYLDVKNSAYSGITEECYKIQVNSDGVAKLFVGEKGNWKAADSGMLRAVCLWNHENYQIELQVPFSVIGELKPEIRVNAEMMHFQSTGKIQGESVIHSTNNQPFTWLKYEIK